MKCLHCDFDSKARDRRNRTCPMCRGKFAFEPTEGDVMTDMAFRNSIDAVSADGSVRWGVEHLYYEVCRRRPAWRPGLGCAGTVFVLFAISAGIYLSARDAPWGVAALVSGAVLVVIVRSLLKPERKLPVTRRQFDAMWHRWQEVYGLPEGVIVRRAPEPDEQRKPAADVGDYSFDRAVICDRARTVDLLLANNFHFEHNCAVLSVDGYPPHAFETVRAMLRRNPRLEVYVLHDATYKGCKLAERLRSDPDWFQGMEIVDVGLRPDQARGFAPLLKPSENPEAARDRTLDRGDAKWLSRNALELAALRPEQIIRAVFRAMNPSVGSGGDGGDGADSFG